MNEKERTNREQGRPMIGVGAVLFDPAHEHVLLVKRGTPPAQGLWSVPGGMVERGESLRAACAREVQEETGLTAQLSREPVKILERLLRNDHSLTHHYLIVDFWGVIERGEPRAASDVSEACWVEVDCIEQRPTTAGLPDVIRRALQVAKGKTPHSPLLELIDDNN
jgi:8-oxo-dGTP diphosphatase